MTDQFADLVEQARAIVREEGRLDIAAFLRSHPKAPEEFRNQLPELVRMWRLLFPPSQATRERVLAAIHAELAEPQAITIADLVAKVTPADLRTLGLNRRDLDPFEDLEDPVSELTPNQMKDLVVQFTPFSKKDKVAGLLLNLRLRVTGAHNSSVLAARPKKDIQIRSDEGNGK